MKNIWTWGGIFFGYIDNDVLFTHFGKSVGIFRGDKIYDNKGRYIGEIYNDRLITHLGSKILRGSACPNIVGGSYVPFCNYVGYVMIGGYEDFPNPKTFK